MAMTKPLLKGIKMDELYVQDQNGFNWHCLRCGAKVAGIINKSGMIDGREVHNDFHDRVEPKESK